MPINESQLIGWVCPNCECKEFDFIEDGRKHCVSCGGVFGLKTKSITKEQKGGEREKIHRAVGYALYWNKGGRRKIE